MPTFTCVDKVLPPEYSSQILNKKNWCTAARATLALGGETLALEVNSQ